MKTIALLTSGAGLCLAILVSGRHPTPNLPNVPFMSIYQPDATRPPLAVCFAPGTSPEYMAEWQERIWQRTSLDYNIGDRWSSTASGETGNQGDPIHLTYSFVPDGITVDGEQNVIHERMNEMFDSEAEWQGLFAQVFDRWSQVSGLTYHQDFDDGAAFRNQSPGILTVRGDVRIAAVSQDGPSGVLAYNYFPDRGDMVMDADENWGNPGQNYIFLRNIVAHEHGHGWGLEHVCPAIGTKLLEPYYSSGFNGPQHDDIRAVQRNYGDRFEPNDEAVSATSLGVLSQDHTVTPVSVDHSDDVDFYSFSIPAGLGVTITCQPIGYEYLDGVQNGDGSCSAGSMINTIDDVNLNMFLYDASGSQILLSGNTHQVGEAEQFYRYAVPAPGGAYMIEVSGSAGSQVQLYDLIFDVYNSSDPYLTICPMDFDSTLQGVPVSRVTSIVNPAASTLSISGISVDGAFSVSPNTPQTIPGSGELELTLTYLATELSEQAGTLTINHSGPGATLGCTLTGFATELSLQFQNGHSFDFGEVGLGETDSIGVIVRAQGNVPLTISAIALQAPFSLGLSLPVELNPTQALILRPRFTPFELGAASGMMVITHSATSSPDTVFLSGTGVASAAESPEPVAAEFRLEQNYPNPFNASTTIAYELPRAARVSLQVLDVQGRLVKELVSEYQAAGEHVAKFDGAGLASGVYLYRLTTPGFSDVGKMVLLK